MRYPTWLVQLLQFAINFGIKPPPAPPVSGRPAELPYHMAGGSSLMPNKAPQIIGRAFVVVVMAWAAIALSVSLVLGIIAKATGHF